MPSSTGWVLGGPSGPGSAENPNIYKTRWNGSEKTYLTKGGLNWNPSWSWSGSRVSFSRAGPRGMQLATIGSDGSGLVVLAIPGLVPVYTPDDKFLVYQTMTSPSEVGIVASYGVGAKTLTHTTKGGKSRGGASFIGSGAASVSPDGKTILYTSSQSGSNQLWTMDITGANKKQLTFPTDPLAPNANAGRISPDGKLIAYYGGFELERGDIYFMNFDGTGRVKLTNCIETTNPGQRATADDPHWSPDGTGIIFGSSMYPDGSGRVDPSGILRTWMINIDRTYLRVLMPILNSGARAWV